MKKEINECKGKLIISAAADKTIIFWNEDYSIRKIHKGSEYQRLLQLKRTGNYIAAGKFNGEIEIFDIKTYELQFTLKGHTNHVYALVEMNSGDLVSGSWDKTLKLWNIQKHRETTCLREFIGHNDWIFCVIQHSSGLLISGSGDKTARIWNPTNGKLLKTIQQEEEIRELQELGNGKILSVCGQIFNAIISMIIWDLVSGDNIYTALVPRIEPHGLFSSYLINQQLVILGGRNGNVLVFDLESKQFIHSYKLHKKLIIQIQQMADELILTASCDKTIILSNWKTGKIVRAKKEHKYGVQSVIIVDENI